MARGRFISESVAKDARLNSLSVEAQLVYLMAVPHLDRDGLIEGDPDVLWGTVCPKRRQFLDRMAAFIQEWAKAGLVLMYDTEDGPALWFRGFAKNQQGMRYDREAPSKFSPPPDSTTPDKLPTNSGNCPAQGQVEDQDQVEDQEGDRTRDPEPIRPPTPPPSYHRTIDPNEYIPGVKRPQYNQTKRNCDHFTGQAAQQGVGPEPFRRMVDAILDATGKTSLANTNGERGQETLNAAKQTVVDLLEMGRRTVEDVEAVLHSWRENDYRGASCPTFRQVVEHASAMDAGTHITAKRQEGSKKDFASFADYNEWAARNDPEYKRIRTDGVVIKGMLVKRDSYQPAMVH